MFTYTGSRNHFGTLVKDSTPATLTIADSLINIRTKRLVNKRAWPFREKTKTISTSAGVQSHDLPGDCGKVISLYATIGSTRYLPKEITRREDWDALNQVATSSDIPQFYFISGNQLLLYPTPATSVTDAITYNYSRVQKDLSIADYLAGSVLTATLGSRDIVGASSVWTSKMAGRVIRVTDSDSANTGDGEWYEIDTVTDATHLSLVAPYNGPSISAGSAPYVIGQCSILPEDCQELPIIDAIRIYYSSINPKPALANLYKEMFQDGYTDMFNQYGSKSSNPVINDPFEDDDDEY